MSIEFKNPPNSNFGPKPSETIEMLAELEARPGEWALIKADVSPSNATWWRKKPGLEVKASTVGKPKGKCDVYARYVGKAA